VPRVVNNATFPPFLLLLQLAGRMRQMPCFERASAWMCVRVLLVESITHVFLILVY